VQKKQKFLTNAPNTTLKSEKKNKKRKKTQSQHHVADYGEDDTPAAFRRLMAFAKGERRLRDGLDDGKKPSKNDRQKQSSITRPEVDTTSDKTDVDKPESLKILPHESLAAFGARVDTALPVSQSLVGRQKGKDPLGLPQKKTRLEKRMQKMQAEWRLEDTRRKETAEDAAEEWNEQFEDAILAAKELENGSGKKKGGKKKKAKRNKHTNADGEDADEQDLRGGDDDPWAVLKSSRQPLQANLHDIAQAPPDLRKMAGSKLLRLGAEVRVKDIPKNAGSLRRREELGIERENVVAEYRRIMAHA
jgi:hypothetical protein